MRPIVSVLLIVALAACGVETATTAATVAAGKKKELEEGKKNMEQMQQNLDKAMQQTQQAAQRADEATK
jgi:prefoldin subunit 5